MTFAEASKIVGWEPRTVVYPPVKRVRHAVRQRDLVRLLTWHRFLPSPTDEEQAEIIEMIVQFLREVQNHG